MSGYGSLMSNRAIQALQKSEERGWAGETAKVIDFGIGQHLGGSSNETAKAGSITAEKSAAARLPAASVVTT